jgi:MFS superfamily sulfate permease-like transporter
LSTTVSTAPVVDGATKEALAETRTKYKVPGRHGPRWSSRSSKTQGSGGEGPLTSTWWADFSAGAVVFLVAVPLCLGVALASGAPLLSGVITGVIGGLLVSLLSGSQLMVSGPAAGLTAIVFAAITELGSFSAFLVAVVLAGLFQLALGFARAGIIAYFFPSSVIKGMLAGIGLILISKQLPYAMGVAPEVFEFTNLASVIANINPTALAISLASILILVLWDRPSMKQLRKTAPGPLIIVVLGVVANVLLKIFAPAYALPQEALVTLPVPDGTPMLAGYLTMPDWTAITNPMVWTVAFTIAIVASLETLLSLEATDKLDPHKRSSPANRELLAQGVGNTLSGLIGGLPMTGVIVRSATNIDAGGRTRKAAFFHGLFLLVAVLAIPSVLNMIPLAALATILMYTGFKLAHPRLFRDAYKIGIKHLIPLAVTVVAILATDLLVGITVGLSVATFFILQNNYRTAFFYHREESIDHHVIRITLSEDVSFLNKASINRLLSRLPDGSRVTIDGSNSQHIDTDVIEILREFAQTAKVRNIHFRLVGIPDMPLVHQLH